MRTETAAILILTTVLAGACSPAPTEVTESAAELAVRPAFVSLRSPGDSAQLEAMIVSGDGRTGGPCADVRWNSSDNRVVTVTSKGKVVAKRLGVASIMAQCALSQGSAAVQVGSHADQWQAFPEAQGWGAQALTTCSRSQVQVIPVTSLENSGPGTLREAIERARDDVLSVITFEVSGVISLEETIKVRTSCLYVAGQTAPGGGITIRAPTRSGLAGSSPFNRAIAS